MRKFRDLDNGHYFDWNGTNPKCLKAMQDVGICKKLTAHSFELNGERFKLANNEIELEANRRAKKR